jgi:hypothetical protein
VRASCPVLSCPVPPPVVGHSFPPALGCRPRIPRSRPPRAVAARPLLLLAAAAVSSLRLSASLSFQLAQWREQA